MTVSLRQLNRATLARQLLFERAPHGVLDGMRRIVAIQAQEPASPYLALWNRLAGFDAADLDAAFTDQTVVKASLMRITLHAVHAEDHAPFHAAMLPSLRASRLADNRFKTAGLSIAAVDQLLPDLLEFTAKARTKTDIEGLIAKCLGKANPRAWWAFKTFAPLLHVATGGPWSFGPRASYVAAPTAKTPSSWADSVQWLVRRYLEGFGPATVLDIAQFSLLRRPVIRDALSAMASDLRVLRGADRAELFDVPDGLLPDEDEPAPPRFLPMWDSILLAYADRSRVIPPDVRRIVIRSNGDVLPTILVDGLVAGVWRPVTGGIEVTAFHALSSSTWRALQQEAAALVAFLAERDPGVYGRYGRWWSALPNTDVVVRRLPG